MDTRRFMIFILKFPSSRMKVSTGEQTLAPPHGHLDAEQGCEKTVGGAGDGVGVKKVADPQISGSSYTALVTRLQTGCGMEDSLTRLCTALDGKQLDSSGAVLTAVADGSALVGITLEETALQHIAAGEDIALVYPSDGTSCVPDGSALVKGAPHGDNARLFLDFTVSTDVQSMVGQRFCRRTVRADIPADPSLPPLSTLNMVSYDVEWASQNRDRLLSEWSFLLGEVPS